MSQILYHCWSCHCETRVFCSAIKYIDIKITTKNQDIYFVLDKRVNLKEQLTKKETRKEIIDVFVTRNYPTFIVWLSRGSFVWRVCQVAFSLQSPKEVSNLFRVWYIHVDNYWPSQICVGISGFCCLCNYLEIMGIFKSSYSYLQVVLRITYCTHFYPNYLERWPT